MLGIPPHIGRAVGPASVVVLVLSLVVPQTVLGALGLQVVPSAGQPGDTVQATATGFAPPPGEVTFWWDGTALLGVDPTIIDGQASLSFVIPAAATIGRHFLRACHGSACLAGRYVDAPVAVTGPTTAPTPSPTASPTPRPTAAPTPRPTSPPTPPPTPRPTGSPVPTHQPPPSVAATASLEPTPPVGTAGPIVPIPSFPIGVATPGPTPLPFAVVTPAPQPPDGLAVPEVQFPNLVVRGIEVTQGMQNLANDMPLVSARRTYARVYVDVEGAESWANVTGGLEARRDGQQLGWIWPENAWIVARAGGGDRSRADDTLNFRLPATWLSGELTLTAFVFSYFVDSPFTEEPDGADNDAAVTIDFEPAEPLTIHLAPLHLHRSYHPTDVERVYELDPGGEFLAPGGNNGAVSRITSGLFRYLPIATLNVDALAGPITPPNHLTGNEWDLGGACSVGLESWTQTNVAIDDWTVLIKDDEDIEDVNIGQYTVPDRDVLRSMDRRFDIDYFYPHADGSASAWGDESGFGPIPPPGAPTWAYPCVNIIPELHETNNALALHRIFYDWSDERELFVGMMDPTLPAPFGGIATASTDSITMRMTDGMGVAIPWQHSGAATIGHEATHQAGLGHVPCKDEDEDGIPDEIDGGGLDETHPMTLTFPDCRLAQTDPAGWYGWDGYWDRWGLSGPTALSNDPGSGAPSLVYPMLSYLYPGWADPYHYCRLLTYFGVFCSPTALDLPWNPPNPKPDGSDPFAGTTPPPAELDPDVDAAMVLVSAGEDDKGWSLKMLARNSSPTPYLRQQIATAAAAPPTAEANRLVVLDADGAVTWQAVMPNAQRPHGTTGSVPTAVVVPIPPDATAVEVRGPDGRTTARIGPSGTPPQIIGATVKVPTGSVPEIDDEVLVAFEHGEGDGGRTEFTLLYAPDREHWQVVHRGTTEREVPVPVAGLPSGDAPAFRIVAFDGWAIAEAWLPMPELGSPRNAPTVMILVRGPATYPLGSQVRLEATAFDLEDRVLAPGAISWSSSLDGPLGAGSELATRDLSRGLHTITASATDSDGLTGAATYVLQVDPSVVETRPSADMDATMAGVFERLAAGVSPDPASKDARAKIQFPWLPAAMVLLVLAAAVVASRWIRMAKPSSSKPRLMTRLTAGTHTPPKPAPPDAPPSALIQHEATHVAPSVETEATAESEAPGGSSDVTLKGSKIKEN